MSQYLVEVTPGRELVYETQLALRAAIRSGQISADSRIFHRATASWISITKHPEYRRVQAELTPRSGTGTPLPLGLVVPPPVPRKRGFIPSLTQRVLALASSGWTSIWKQLDSRSTKTPPKPASPGQPSQPAQQVEPRSSNPTDRHWTYLP
jgi:hypothetical protein